MSKCDNPSKIGLFQYCMTPGIVLHQICVMISFQRCVILYTLFSSLIDWIISRLCFKQRQSVCCMCACIYCTDTMITTQLPIRKSFILFRIIMHLTGVPVKSRSIFIHHLMQVVPSLIIITTS